MSQPRLLLVDDDRQTGVLVGIHARRTGCHLTHRLDAESAWAELRASRPDLVLLDVNLPGMSGVELLQRIRSGAAVADLPVALFSQPGLVPDLIAGWRAGADFLVTKDLMARPERWQKRIEEILARGVGRGAPVRLGWKKGAGVRSAEKRNSLLAKVLGHPVFRTLDQKFIPELFRRARDHVRSQNATGENPSGTDEFLALLGSLEDQVWCLLGSEARDQVSTHIRQVLSSP